MKQIEILEEICNQVYGVKLKDLELEKFDHFNAVIMSLYFLQDIEVEDNKWKNMLNTCSKCNSYLSPTKDGYCCICGSYNI